MNWWEGVILGIVQGLTEFLPVSSSGHLVVAQAVIGLDVPGVFVEVVLHVATLLAVVVVYRRRIWDLVRGVGTGERDAWRSIGLLVLATIPVVIVGWLFGTLIERSFESLAFVGIGFLVTGAILWTSRWVRVRARDEPTASGAVSVGGAQALAMLPGISRSGTTVVVGMWLGLDPVRAAEFSFLMAIPAIAGAAVLQIPDMTGEALAIGVGPLVVSFLAALFSGVFAIRLLVRMLARGALHRFAPYCWSLGVVTLGWVMLGG